MPDHDPYLMQIYKRVLVGQDPALAQISFDERVLDRYRESKAYELIRTNTVGRIRKQGGWSLDVGIGEGTVHASLHDVMNGLPEEDRAHWAQHVVTLPLSHTFLQMRLVGGACIDDGEVRDWT